MGQTLENYYQTMFTLQYKHGFSMDSLDGRRPFELEIFVGFLNAELERQKNEIENSR